MLTGAMMHFGAWLTLGVLVTTVECSREPTDDVSCTRFEYEYKVLERLVKLEFDDKTMQSKITDMDTKCCASSKPSPKNPSVVAVKARMSGPKAVKDGDRFIFDIIVTNVGDAYDTKNGVFTAPVGGIYSFSVCVCLDPSKWMVVGIFHNTNKIGQMLAGDDQYHDCATDYTTARLNAFDKVWVEKIRGSATIVNVDYGWNSFSANLIQIEDA